MTWATLRVMRQATSERIQSLRRGWRVRLALADDTHIEGTVSDVTEMFVRVGEDGDDGRSLLIGATEPKVEAVPVIGIEVIDTDGEIVSEVVDRIKGTNVPPFVELDEGEDVQSGPVRTVIAHPENGYDEPEDVGAHLDDMAADDAEDDQQRTHGRSLLAVLYMPMGLRECGEILAAFGSQFPDSVLGNSSDPKVIRIYGTVGEA